VHFSLNFNPPRELIELSVDRSSCSGNLHRADAARELSLDKYLSLHRSFRTKRLLLRPLRENDAQLPEETRKPDARRSARGGGGWCTGDAAGDCRWNWSRNPLSESRRIAVSVDARTGIVGETDREIYDRDDPRERDYNLGVVCGGWGGGREGGKGGRRGRGRSRGKRHEIEGPPPIAHHPLSLSLSLVHPTRFIHRRAEGGREGTIGPREGWDAPRESVEFANSGT